MASVAMYVDAPARVVGVSGTTTSAAKRRSSAVLRKSVEERFWEKVDTSNSEGCWEWIGAKTTTGYGFFVFRHIAPKRQMIASRAAYILTYGEIDRKLVVCHRCDNRSCVRPSHLFVGTPKDNMQDCVKKLRIAFGTRDGLAKLTDEAVREIRQRGARGEPQRSIAARYLVSQHTVCAVIAHKTWKHVL